MEARINVITLAVGNLERALTFYRDGLGFEASGVIASEFPGDEINPAGAIAMFHLKGGLILTVYPRTELAKDARVPYGPPKTGEFSIGHSVASKAAVDALLVHAEAAGATITDRAHDRPWGIYSGYFQDPDGHLWEILFNAQPPWTRPDASDAARCRRSSWRRSKARIRAALISTTHDQATASHGDAHAACRVADLEQNL